MSYDFGKARQRFSVRQVSSGQCQRIQDLKCIKQFSVCWPSQRVSSFEVFTVCSQACLCLCRWLGHTTARIYHTESSNCLHDLTYGSCRIPRVLCRSEARGGDMSVPFRYSALFRVTSPISRSGDITFRNRRG